MGLSASISNWGDVWEPNRAAFLRSGVCGAFVGLYTVVDGKTIANAGKDDSQSKEQRFGGDSQSKEKIFEDNGARDRGMPYLFHPRMQSLKFDWRPQWGCWRSNDAHRELWGSLM